MSIVINDAKIQEFINNRVIENIYPSKEFLEDKLKSGEKLSLYIGIDATGPDMHLGHSTNFFLLKKFQDLGHQVIIVVGDFTAQIGDPTGKDISRKPLSEKEISTNSKTYKNQIGKILNLKNTEFRYNSKWLNKLNLKESIELFSHKTVQRLLSRDMFRKRLKEGKPISVHEFIYPFLQGYDSVAMEVDGEVGGNDQMFNMLIGRELEKEYLGKEKFVITTRLLINPITKNKLMSKSEGNYVSLQDSPQEMYNKVLALPDEVVFDCFDLCTQVPMENINYLKKGDILVAKHELAFEITNIYHGIREAKFAKEEFKKVFKEGKVPQEVPEIEIKEGDINIVDLLIKTNLVKSASEAKRLIEEGAVEIDGIKIINWHNKVKLKDGAVIRVGPRHFVKIRI